MADQATSGSFVDSTFVNYDRHVVGKVFDGLSDTFITRDMLGVASHFNDKLLSRLLSLANPDNGTRRTKALITKLSLPTIHSCHRDSWRISATPITTASALRYVPRSISVIYAKMIIRQSSAPSAIDSVLLKPTQLFLILQPYRISPGQRLVILWQIPP